MRRTMRHNGATLKTQVAWVAVSREKTVAELAEQFHVRPTQITEWKHQLLARAADVLDGTKPPSDTPDLKTCRQRLASQAGE
jgi:transposase